MAIDSLNQISNEQLLAMNMLSNGQVTNDSSSNSSTNDETNLAFQLVMKNLAEKNSNKSTVTEINKKAQEANNNDNKASETDVASNSADLNAASKGVAARAIQKYAAGQRLEDIPLILNNRYSNVGKSSGSILANRSDVDIKKIYSAVSTAANNYGVDSNLILAIIKQESDFDPYSTSGVGAAGLMQIMPENFNHLGITDAYDVDQNINGGTKLLKEYLDQYDGNTELALMAYNGGPGTMQKRGVSSAADLYKMPQETRNYVPKVMGYYGSGV